MRTPDSRATDEPRISLVTIDKVIILFFVLLLLSEEVKALLIGTEWRWVYLLSLSFGTAYVATPIFYFVAYRFDIVDVPGGRKTHSVPTALLGGAAIYTAFAVTLLQNFDIDAKLMGITLAGTLIFVIGLVDDIRTLPARWRLLEQLLAVGILIRYGVVLTFLPPGLWGSAGEWLLTAVWVIGITNAINFLDGLDGLAAGSCAINACFFGLVALQTGQGLMMLLALSLMGACLGFLPYNFRPQRPAAIFMGDAGSTFLGFMMASLAVMGEWAGDHVVRLIVPILIMGTPIFDTTFTTLMRVKQGKVRSFREWIECGDRDHIQDYLVGLRIGRKSAVLVLYVVTVWLGLAAVNLENATGMNAVLQVVQSVVIFLLLSFFMVFVQRKYTEIERGAGSD